MKKFFLTGSIVVGLVILFLAAIYYFRGNEITTEQGANLKDNQAAQQAIGSTAPEINSPIDQVPDYKVSVSISSYGFMPGILTVKEGEVLQLSVVSVDSSKHSFNFSPKIDGVGKIEIMAGKTEIIKFVVPAAGTYTYSCQEPGHEKETGRMIVASRNAAAAGINNQATENSGSVQKTSPPAMPAYELMLSVSGDGYYPKEFSVNAGQSVKLTILPVDNSQHAFKFVQPVAGLGTVVLKNNQSNIINFQAPLKGVYEFICPEVGHEKEKGKMIVN